MHRKITALGQVDFCIRPCGPDHVPQCAWVSVGMNANEISILGLPAMD